MLVEPGAIGKNRLLIFKPAQQQPLEKRVIIECAFRPVLEVEIVMHQELGEGEEAELDPVAVERPAGLPGHSLGDRIKIDGRGPLLFLIDLRQDDAEILSEAFLQRQVGGDVFVARLQVIGGFALVADEFHRQQDQRRLAHHLRLGIFLPPQETHREKENVEALLLLGGLGVVGHAQDAPRQRFRPSGVSSTSSRIRSSDMSVSATYSTSFGPSSSSLFGRSLPIALKCMRRPSMRRRR